MPRRGTMIEIDGQKLKEEIEKHDLTIKEVAVRTFRPYSTIHNAISRNVISKELAGAINNLCGIPLDAYQVKYEGMEEKPKTVDWFDRSELYDLIYHAVYEAVKRAWSE